MHQRVGAPARYAELEEESKKVEALGAMTTATSSTPTAPTDDIQL
ncbi:hypothetical protein [Pseudovibrio sp. SCP19]